MRFHRLKYEPMHFVLIDGCTAERQKEVLVVVPEWEQVAI